MLNDHLAPQQQNRFEKKKKDFQKPEIEVDKPGSSYLKKKYCHKVECNMFGGLGNKRGRQNDWRIFFNPFRY